MLWNSWWSECRFELQLKCDIRDWESAVISLCASPSPPECMTTCIGEEITPTLLNLFSGHWDVEQKEACSQKVLQLKFRDVDGADAVMTSVYLAFCFPSVLLPCFLSYIPCLFLNAVFLLVILLLSVFSPSCLLCLSSSTLFSLCVSSILLS